MISIILVKRFERLKLWPNFKIFFSIIFLFTWAGGIWLVPFGPVFRGVPILTFLASSLFAALVLSASLSSIIYLTRPRKKGREIKLVEIENALNVFFRALIIFLVFTIIARYTFFA
jgi:hypothetical protein